MAARGNSFSAVKKARAYISAALELANRLCGRLYCLREIRRLLAAAAEISLREHLVRLFIVCGLRTQELTGEWAAHSIDNGSASETSGGANLQDAFNPNAFRGPSDFDIRQAVSANAIVDIPIGKGKALFGKMPGWLDVAVGGWQASTLFSFHTGTPISCSVSGVYNVNYLYSSYCIDAPGATTPASGFSYDQNNVPSIFANTSAVNSFVASYPGIVGNRGVLRGPHFSNMDVAVSKYFKLPQKENIRLQLCGEAYNVLNHENFSNLSVNTATPTTFGEITSTSGAARVLQDR
jgi:hypothetical protein